MLSNLYIPTKIKVGFQNRNDTYTGKLGFVTYMDQKGVVKQENSWNGWRDSKITPIEYENKPAKFVFNKNVNRHGYWSDITKVRIYDTRDFEFEIDVSNMMYLLMHSDVSKRDIKEECVFAWSGKKLFLISVNSEEYLNSIENTKKLNTKFSLKDLIVGHMYSTKNMSDVVYLGFFDWSEKKYNYSYEETKTYFEDVGKRHIFYVEKEFYALNGAVLVEDISKEVVENFAFLRESLSKDKRMKRHGKFFIKKTFDMVGYNKTSYLKYKVTLQNPGKKANNLSFKIQEVDFLINDDVPSIKVNSNYRSLEYNYLEDMKKKKINIKNVDDVRKYFEENGFGELNFTNSKGETIKM